MNPEKSTNEEQVPQLKDMQLFITECLIDSPSLRPLWIADKFNDLIEPFADYACKSDDDNAGIKAIYFFISGLITFYFLNSSELPLVFSIFLSCVAGVISLGMTKLFNIILAILLIVLFYFPIEIFKSMWGYLIFYRKFSKEQLFIIYEALLIDWAEALEGKSTQYKEEQVAKCLKKFIEEYNEFKILSVRNFVNLVTVKREIVVAERKKNKARIKDEAEQSQKDKELKNVKELNREKIIAEIFKKL